MSFAPTGSGASLVSLSFLLFPGSLFSHFFLYSCLSLSLALLFLLSAFFKHPTAILHLKLLFFHAFTFHVDSSAFVTELELAFASHMVTAFILLHPKLALRTLFELLPLDECHEFLVVFRSGGADLVLLASHVLMPFYSAV